MPKKTTGLDAPSSGFNAPLQEAITLMGDNLVAWRHAPESAPDERQQYLDGFLIAASDGYRQMATKLLRGRKRVDELDRLIASGELDESDAADDLAQLCILSLLKLAGNSDFKAPFVPVKIDELLAESVRYGLPTIGVGAPISAYLHGLLFRSVARRIRDITKNAKKSQVTSENLIPQTDLLNLTEDDRPMGEKKSASAAKRVSLQQNVEFARKIQDDYLDRGTHKGRPLRDLFGKWTPLDEWIECCDFSDRPCDKVIGTETLRKHINDIRFLICLAKSKVNNLTDEPDILSIFPDKSNGKQQPFSVPIATKFVGSSGLVRHFRSQIQLSEGEQDAAVVEVPEAFGRRLD